jgi:outer membrane lipase/esterase
MKQIKHIIGASLAALLLASCGGGGGETVTNKVGFTSLVSFGDSLSDVGTAKVGAVAALGGGKWTVNSPTAKNWTELIAAQYGLPAPCAAQTGLFPVIPGFTGAATQNFSTCRNYAQGSSRVTSPAGPNSVAIQSVAPSAAPLGLIALPVATQMTNHLANVGGAYTGKELVTVMAGGNDFFMNLNGVNSAFDGGVAAVGAAQFAGWSATVQGQVFGGGTAAVSAAANAAVAGMAQAATELAGYIKTNVTGKGAKYVAVVNLPDVVRTPFGINFDAQTKALGGQMIAAFNNTLKSELASVAGVVLIDASTQSTDQVTNPAQYGLTNVTSAACSKTSTANPLQGSSITCTAASTVAGDTSKYLFADDVHLTPFGYQLLAQFVTLKLTAAGW